MTPLESPATDVTSSPSLEGRRYAYLLGIGGVGMSGAAEILLDRGHRVEGEDRQDGPRLAHLRERGAEVRAGAPGRELPSGVDLVVASAAIPTDHPVAHEARRRGLRVWKYADLVGALMADRYGVCVAGTHGKTTTTALVAHALLHAGRDPSYLVGGDLMGHASGARSGRGAHFVAESCEYDRSFHRHRPRLAIVTNVDADHLDYYADLAEIQEAFRLFAARLPSDGVLIVHESAAGLFRGDARLRAPLATYGLDPTCDWHVRAVRSRRAARHSSFELARRGSGTWAFEVPLVGVHNVLNAAVAAAALITGGLDPVEARDALAAFPGVGRRLELVADHHGVLVFDDYAHHPAEVRATIHALRERHPDRRLLVIFQPHQASRTRRHLAEFAAALAPADQAWIPPIYFARDSEADRTGVCAADLARAVTAAGGCARAFGCLSDVVEEAARTARPGDVLVTMGAGNVDEVARGLAARLL